ncbi:hypothetical protein QBC34DRAFT_415500 [Podospora aff. communis PSN243]|uniref:Uncharacterized protein n=1 Tax=Podospora aff. communis PSN243 TaxID=3040156 RepID=A0AAV9G9N2_9PEZI|nr:hypothetical protein QBC34DRAFT_415500 [Podospora aff. communis PSN243]
MAVGLDKLERRFERLEKFFSKKRRGPGRAADGSLVSPLSLSAMSDSLFRTFPQPSFIRPTSTRMLAREEVSLTYRPEQRSQSLPETQTTPRLMSETPTLEEEPAPRTSISQPPRIPKRSSSLSPTRRPASLASLGELLEFSFANTPRTCTAAKHQPESRSRSGSISPKTQPNRKPHFDERPGVYGAPRRQQHPITPPPSAEYDKSFASTKQGYQDGLPLMGAPKTPTTGELTPEPSPKFASLLGYESDTSEMDETAQSQRPRSLGGSAGLFREAKVSLRRSVSCSSLGKPKPGPKVDPPSDKATSRDAKKTEEKSTHNRRRHGASREPSVSDFLSLSDEDVSGDSAAPLARLPVSSKPPSCALPPDPPGLVLSPQVSAGTRLLTLSPPLATRPATAAAFEAARIAARYRFDLVYVVNLWPRRMGSSSSSFAPGELSPRTTDGTPRVEMTGRLLAAYGLPYIKSPFRISESVHLRALRTQDWLEYQCENVTPEEFSRGYSCSFYTANSLGRRSKSTDKGATEGTSRDRKGTAPNRGVVFAAYRLPRADGQDLQSSQAELDALRMDAEALVDMLIDIHMTQRQRRVVAPSARFAAGAGTPPTSNNAVLSS